MPNDVNGIEMNYTTGSSSQVAGETTTEMDTYLRAKARISELEKLVRALVEFVDDRVLDSIMDEFPILKAIMEGE